MSKFEGKLITLFWIDRGGNMPLFMQRVKKYWEPGSQILIVFLY
jgi:hypothetical protein